MLSQIPTQKSETASLQAFMVTFILKVHRCEENSTDVTSTKCVS